MATGYGLPPDGTPENALSGDRLVQQGAQEILAEVGVGLTDVRQVHRQRAGGR